MHSLSSFWIHILRLHIGIYGVDGLVGWIMSNYERLFLSVAQTFRHLDRHVIEEKHFFLG